MNYKKIVASVVGKTPLWRLGEILKKRPRVLFYHGVIDGPFNNVRVQANQMLFENFRKQILFLKQHFQFLSIDEFYSRFTNHDKFTGKEIVLTFDDGYKNNLYVAAPLLDELQIPFTVFVSTRAVENESFIPTYYVRSAVFSSAVRSIDVPTLKRKFILDSEIKRVNAEREIIHCIKTSDETCVRSIINDIENHIGQSIREEINSYYESERILSWKEVTLLHNSGVVIGAHCADHCILHKNQSPETILSQLRDSKEAIISHIGECRYFAFPNGDKTSVCDYSLSCARNMYNMSFAVNGKCVGCYDPIEYISRIGIAPTLELMKVQLSLLA